MKLPNDLIKATDYEKAKGREIKEFECVNGEVIQHYALGGEHELTMQEVVDCLNALATIDCDLQTAYSYIEGQKDKIADLEAKLEESESKVAVGRFWHFEYDQLKRQLAEKEKAKIEFAIQQLQRVKEDVLDIGNGYWRYFMKNGKEYMTVDDLENCLNETIDQIIKELEGEIK